MFFGPNQKKIEYNGKNCFAIEYDVIIAYHEDLWGTSKWA